jgi:peptidoglycan/LPS O-acetylase OafA/YrhL
MPKIPALTGLRGALAVWVVLFHITSGFAHRGIPLETLMSAPLLHLLFSGSVAVDGFFILSGFVMAYVHGRDFDSGGWLRQAARFWALRLARIYPVHLAVMLAYFAGHAYGFAWPIETCGNPFNRPGPCDRFDLGLFWAHIGLTASWGVNPVVGWNFAAWSLNSEWFAYVLTPLLFVSVFRLSQPLAALLVLVTMVAMVILLAHWAYQFQGLPDDYGLMRVVPEYLCGVLLFRCSGADWFKRVPWGAVGAIGVFVMVGMLAVAWNPNCSVLLLPLLIGSLASSQIGKPAPLARLLEARPMQWLGAISYSLYMSHLLVLELLSKTAQDWHFKSSGRLLLVYVASLVPMLVAAHLVHVGIEEPARVVLRRMIRPVRPVTTPPAPVTLRNRV